MHAAINMFYSRIWLRCTCQRTQNVHSMKMCGTTKLRIKNSEREKSQKILLLVNYSIYLWGTGKQIERIVTCCASILIDCVFSSTISFVQNDFFPSFYYKHLFVAV